MKKFFAGVGGRETPSNICKDMKRIASILEEMGYTLRSGNATGADQAFASGVKKNAQIWLPFSDFEKGFQEKHPEHEYITYSVTDEEAFDSVKKFHPKPENLRFTGRYMMGRNFRQIVGNGEPNSSFVICWTREGKEVGGTGQALRIANHYNIPVFNLFSMSWEEIIDKIKFMNLLEES